MRLSTGVRHIVITAAVLAGGCGRSREGRPVKWPPNVWHSRRAFSSITSIRELRTGRLVVVDALERSVVALDPETDSGRVLIHNGSGPGEVESPVIALMGAVDSTYVFDAGLRRYLVLSPSGAPIRSFPASVGSTWSTTGTSFAMPASFSDSLGRLYVQLLRGSGSPLRNDGVADSAAVVRWSPANGGVDTLAWVSVPQNFVRRSVSGNDVASSVGMADPLAPSDAWAVSAGGIVFVARAADYHVEQLQPGLPATTGAPIPYDHLQVTPEDREQLDQLARRFTIRRRQVDFVDDRSTIPASSRPASESVGMPKAAFPRAGMFVAPGDTLWVLRYTKTAGPPSSADIVAPDGRRLYRVPIMDGERLLLAGRYGVYFTRSDDNDLLYIVRRAYPESRD